MLKIVSVVAGAALCVLASQVVLAADKGLSCTTNAFRPQEMHFAIDSETPLVGRVWGTLPDNKGAWSNQLKGSYDGKKLVIRLPSGSVYTLDRIGTGFVGSFKSGGDPKSNRDKIAFAC